MDDEDLKSIEVQMLIDLNSLKASEFNVRPMIIQLAKLFDCRITINDKELGLVADASSFGQLVSWEFTTSKKYSIRAKGVDADMAIRAFREAFESMTSEQMYAVYCKYRKKLRVDGTGHESCGKFIEKSVKARVLFSAEGVHMHPSMYIVEKANKFASDIVICMEEFEYPIDAKSIMEVAFMQSLTYGDEIRLVACGPDADVAVKILKEAFESRKLYENPPYC